MSIFRNQSGTGYGRARGGLFNPPRMFFDKLAGVRNVPAGVNTQCR
jgi:hypothetical protein